MDGQPTAIDGTMSLRINITIAAMKPTAEKNPPTYMEALNGITENPRIFENK